MSLDAPRHYRAGGNPGAEPHDASHPGFRLRGNDVARIALLGTGTVGIAFLQRLARLDLPVDLVATANSRWCEDARGRHPADLDATLATLGAHGRRIVVDATGSEAVAARHVAWLARGVSVVTASKLGTGTSLARWRAIRHATAIAHYGDAATVGAGLPILRTLRELRAGGDRVHAISGSLSGTLGWLFSRFDGSRPFSQLVAQAKSLGYTEPDPRHDLSGDDVRRKLLILARTAGAEIDVDEVAVESLADASDDDLAARLRPGRVLRHVARWTPGRARVSLESLARDHALAQGEDCDNRVAIWSDRYRERPLVIQGPGAGADVTAAALLDDVVRIAAPESPAAVPTYG